MKCTLVFLAFVAVVAIAEARSALNTELGKWQQLRSSSDDLLDLAVRQGKGLGKNQGPGKGKGKGQGQNCGGKKGGKGNCDSSTDTDDTDEDEIPKEQSMSGTLAFLEYVARCIGDGRTDLKRQQGQNEEEEALLNEMCQNASALAVLYANDLKAKDPTTLHMWQWYFNLRATTWQCATLGEHWQTTLQNLADVHDFLNLLKDVVEYSCQNLQEEWGEFTKELANLMKDQEKQTGTDQQTDGQTKDEGIQPEEKAFLLKRLLEILSDVKKRK